MKKTYKSVFGNEVFEIKNPYKEPIFLFTSSSLRFAAYAGWYSAFGQREKCEEWIHQAHREWVKELGAGRKYSFLDRTNDDMYKYIPGEVMDKLVNKFFRDIKEEIKKGRNKNFFP
ncbi:hypothetical protein A2975_02915 [Candidatus Woesebacteria bacterium RIFCSPLOWO2_01_FULL_44_14]|uniref:Uncharacterized protein n=1 Tax=Candidatus Woesebacteria bacterium RIFCSPLOWO2_01_FULL_44_14 TaxID=1802525 RepID=A0A1F8BZA1_9BACT|nr:MAG: hypothetical protein A2975_02915 [Candidatus Woesebacteria bacterium RIFCSPLOWO2_01_FULL_44_14]